MKKNSIEMQRESCVKVLSKLEIEDETHSGFVVNFGRFVKIDLLRLKVVMVEGFTWMLAGGKKSDTIPYEKIPIIGEWLHCHRSELVSCCQFYALSPHPTLVASDEDHMICPEVKTQCGWRLWEILVRFCWTNDEYCSSETLLQQKCLFLRSYAHRIHGTGTFTYMNGWFLW